MATSNSAPIYTCLTDVTGQGDGDFHYGVPQSLDACRICTIGAASGDDPAKYVNEHVHNLSRVE